jgi:hypothetical protein
MAADGRCRCGNLLRFRRGQTGYKTRCPVCHAMVRLQKAGRRKQGTEQVSVSEPTPSATKNLPPLPPLEPAAVPATAPLPMVEMMPLMSPAPAAVGIQVWRWPVWLASAAALTLVVVVLLLVRRS